MGLVLQIVSEMVSILYWAFQIWNLNCLEDVERVQLSFLKLLNLSNCIPDYAVKHKTDSSHLAIKIFKLTMFLLTKISRMDFSRYKVVRYKLINIIKKEFRK